MKRLLWLFMAASPLFIASAAQAAPLSGVPQEIRTGLFADVNLGAYLTLGGADQAGATGPSNPQVYSQFAIGYDFTREWSAFVTFGMGASAASCFAIDDRGNPQCYKAPTGNALVYSDNFTATMFTAEAAYNYFMTDRLSLRPHLGGGYSLLGPAPMADANGEPIDSALIVGGGVGILYATHMDHFKIGIDVSGRYLIGPDFLSLAVTPYIQYTF